MRLFSSRKVDKGTLKFELLGRYGCGKYGKSWLTVGKFLSRVGRVYWKESEQGKV